MTFVFHLFNGNLDLLKTCFDVLGGIFSNSIYSAFAKIGIIFGMFFTGISILKGGKNEELFKQLIAIFAVGVLFTVSNVNVTLLRVYKTSTTDATTISNKYPLGIVLPMWIANELGFWTAELIDYGFGCPTLLSSSGYSSNTGINDSACYTSSGIGGSVGVIASLQQLVTQNDRVVRNLNVYVKKCLLPAIDIGAVNPEDFSKVPDLGTYLYNSGLVNWYMTYQAAPGSAGVTGCSLNSGTTDFYTCDCKAGWLAVYNDLKDLESDFLNQIKANIGGSSFLNASIVTSLVKSTYGLICQKNYGSYACLNSSLANSVLAQAFLARNLDSYIANIGGNTSYAAQISESYRNTTTGWKAYGMLMLNFLPKIRVILMIIMPFIFLFILPFLFLPPRWIAVSFLLNFFWLASWNPLLAVINDIFTVKFFDYLRELNGSLGYNIGSMFNVLSYANEELAIIGYVASFVLMLSSGIINLIGYNFGARGALMNSTAIQMGLRGVGKDVGLTGSASYLEKMGHGYVKDGVLMGKGAAQADKMRFTGDLAVAQSYGANMASIARGITGIEAGNEEMSYFNKVSNSSQARVINQAGGENFERQHGKLQADMSVGAVTGAKKMGIEAQEFGKLKEREYVKGRADQTRFDQTAALYSFKTAIDKINLQQGETGLKALGGIIRNKQQLRYAMDTFDSVMGYNAGDLLANSKIRGALLENTKLTDTIYSEDGHIIGGKMSMHLKDVNARMALAEKMDKQGFHSIANALRDVKHSPDGIGLIVTGRNGIISNVALEHEGKAVARDMYDNINKENTLHDRALIHSLTGLPDMDARNVISYKEGDYYILTGESNGHLFTIKTKGYWDKTGTVFTATSTQERSELTGNNYTGKDMKEYQNVRGVKVYDDDGNLTFFRNANIINKGGILTITGEDNRGKYAQWTGRGSYNPETHTVNFASTAEQIFFEKDQVNMKGGANATYTAIDTNLNNVLDGKNVNMSFFNAIRRSAATATEVANQYSSETDKIVSYTHKEGITAQMTQGWAKELASFDQKNFGAGISASWFPISAGVSFGQTLQYLQNLGKNLSAMAGKDSSVNLYRAAMNKVFQDYNSGKINIQELATYATSLRNTMLAYANSQLDGNFNPDISSSKKDDVYKTFKDMPSVFNKNYNNASADTITETRKDINNGINTLKDPGPGQPGLGINDTFIAGDRTPPANVGNNIGSNPNSLWNDYNNTLNTMGINNNNLNFLNSEKPVVGGKKNTDNKPELK